jgi:hypothetical protein
MSKKLRLGAKLLLLVCLLVPTVILAQVPSFTRGNPCHGESTLYYSDATYTTVVGGNEYICWSGHHVWGQWTPYPIYTYHEQCCSNCAAPPGPPPHGVCGIEP